MPEIDEKESKNSIELTLVSNDCLISAKNWMRHADTNFDATQTLYNAKNYHLACYHFQQTVEIATKAFGLLTGYLKNNNDARTKIRHDAYSYFNSFKKIITDSEPLSQFDDICYSKLIDMILDYILIFVDDEEERMRIQDYFAELRKDNDTKQLMEKGVEYLLILPKEIPSSEKYTEWKNNMDLLEKHISLIKNVILELENNPTYLKKEEYLEMMSELVYLGLSKTAVYSNIREASNKILKESIRDVCGVYLNPDIFMKILKTQFYLIFITEYIKYLGLITRPLESRTRYPSDDNIDNSPLSNPIDEYNNENPIIQMFDSLINHTKIFLGLISELIDTCNK